MAGATELQQALAEISAIRGQLARGMEFRGYGPGTLAATGVLAQLAAGVQALWLEDAARTVNAWLTLWVGTAALSLIIIAVETVARARRVHSGLAMQLVHAALEQFLPAIVAGLLLTVVLWRSAPQALWLLPGLWQVLFSLGVFSSCRFLPRPMFAVGLWYLATGLACLVVGGGSRAFSPWLMGVPFGVGQLLVAAVLQFGYRRDRRLDEPGS
jgi:hypothetical protein